MLASKKIRNLFSKMILFNGKLAFNPNTLNNAIHTYFLTHDWQARNMQELSQKSSAPVQYTVENWMNLVKNVADFRDAYSSVV